MAEDFENWIRPGYELVTVRLQWNVQVPTLQTEDKGQRGQLSSSLFSPQETPNTKWELRLYERGTCILIFVSQCDSEGEIKDYVDIVLPIQVKMSILNKRGEKVYHRISPKFPHYRNHFYLSKEDIIKSKCQQSDESLTFNCKIFTHVKKEPSTSSSADTSSDAINCGCAGLSSHLEELFNSKRFSDVILNIHGREFPAHKNILVARSEVFAAMFQHPMKEQSTNQIKIEDIEPDVLQELLRFIYTGRVQVDKLETMATGLFIAADKYLLDELKMKCENYLVHHMSPNNCVVLLLHGDLQNPAESLKEAAKFLRHFPNHVMATDGWKKMKQENPVLLCDIQQFILCKK